MIETVSESINIHVSSEIGRLQKVMIHSPDGGIGNVPTNKLHDWLYDDIVDLDKIQDEYERFQILLHLFLDKTPLFNNDEFVIDPNGNIKTDNKGNKLFENNPEKENYYIKKNELNKSVVLDTQFILQCLFEDYPLQTAQLIEGICAVEGVHTYRKKDLLALINEGAKDKKYLISAAKTLLTGKLEYQKKHYENGYKIIPLNGNSRYIFPPIPNFIFTRDIGVTIGNHLLITKPRFNIRKREVVLLQFIAENFLFPKEYDHTKIINVAEDDDFFQTEEINQDEYKVNYEGGDFMMVSKRHLLIGCSERTSPYAIQKLVHRLFWEDIQTENENQLDIISVIKISERRSQMHIDTVISHLDPNTWIIHSPLSEEWQEIQKEADWYEKSYTDNLFLKSENQLDKEKDVKIFQFYLNSKGKEIKKKYLTANEIQKKALKSEFKKIGFLLRINNTGRYKHVEKNCPYKIPPNGLDDLLRQISKEEYHQSTVNFILSGGGTAPHDCREQWTDACNLLILKPGVAIGYDRNYRTAKHFNDIMSNKPFTSDAKFVNYYVKLNKQRFRNLKDNFGKVPDLKHIIHVDDLINFIVLNMLNRKQTEKLINSIQNTLILLPSNELSRARGGSHCMSLPLVRDKI